jgi:hypothetical protein
VDADDPGHPTRRRRQARQLDHGVEELDERHLAAPEAGFKDKDELIAAVIDRSFTRWVAALDMATAILGAADRLARA